MREDRRQCPRQGWVLAGTIDGQDANLALLDRVAGMQHVLRHACTLAAAGVERIVVIWQAESPPPNLDRVAADERLGNRELRVVTRVPEAGEDDAVLLVRGDRIFHRDMPKLLAAAWQTSERDVVAFAGTEHDAVFAASGIQAQALARSAYQDDGLASAVRDAAAREQVATIEPPWLGFTVATQERRAVARAERLLVRSLRKTADGLVSRLLNRRISLFCTRFLAHTPIRPNHMTVFCFLCALAGGIAIAQGSYIAGVIGFALVELGSILDGCDGELSRLKYMYSRLGQWMDTVTDDLSNVFFTTGTMISLHHAGVEWALPVGLSALGAFLFTQAVQYYYIGFVYHSGDLAAIPWAMQDSASLSARPTEFIPFLKATIPRLLKRDVSLSVFMVLAVLGRLDVILLIFSAGSLAFFFVFNLQWFRARDEIAAHKQAQ